MRTCDEEMKMTPKLSDKHERISPEDMAWAKKFIDEYFMTREWRTYAFNITSDMLADSKETQS